jgi:hypothetical protein
MAKAVLPSGFSGLAGDQPLEIELKQPWIAALLALCLPGLGHLYQGRTAKGLLFFICVFGTFVFGLVIGHGKVVYASSQGDEVTRWQYFCQLGIGLPATPALLQQGRPEGSTHPIFGDFMAPPSKRPQTWIDHSGNESTQPNELALWTVALHPRFELGTVYTVIAGLLNILVVCDAYAGPMLLATRPKKDEEPDDDSSKARAG